MKPMKNRVVRMPDDIWNAAQEQAQAQDTTLSAVIRGFLLGYGTKYLAHQELRMLVPVAANYTDPDAHTTPETLRAEALVQFQKQAAEKGRQVAGEITMKTADPAMYLDVDGIPSALDGVVLLMFTVDTVPAVKTPA